jgi:esterase
MIVMHGLLGNVSNWRSLCRKPDIIDKRDCYLVEMRNHARSDHHAEHNYSVMADDIIRFADQQNLDKFTLLGHSMGGRTSLNAVARYPDRVEAAISVDAAPVDESYRHRFGSFTLDVVSNKLIHLSVSFNS